MRWTIETVPPPDWDQFVDHTADDVTQTLFFARLRQRLDGATSYFARFHDGDKTAGSLLLLRDVPGARQRGRSWRQSLFWLAHRLAGGRLFWNSGPVVIPGFDLAKCLGSLLDEVDKIAHTAAVAAIGPVTLPATSPHIDDPDVREVFLARGYKPRRWATFLIDLRQGEQAVWAGLKRAARKSVRRAERDAVITEIQGEQDLRASFFEPYQEAETQAGRSVEPWSTLQAVHAEDTTGRYAFFVARQEDDVLGMLGLYVCGGVAHEIASGLLPVAMERSIPAQDLLHWHAIRWACGRGCHSFDLAGVNPTAADGKESGIRRFKEKWGGRYVEFDVFEKHINWRGRVLHALRRRVRP